MKRTELRKRAKSHSQGWWQTKCDDLMQDIHKTMFDRCMVCGGKNEVGHHFITKSLSSFLRYDFRNLVPLCHSCHFKHHISSDPSVSATIIAKNGEEWFDWLERNRRNEIKRGIHELKIIHEQFTNYLTRPISWTTSTGFKTVSETVNTEITRMAVLMTSPSSPENTHG